MRKYFPALLLAAPSRGGGPGTTVRMPDPADASMRGRASGDRGNAMVTDYIASEFRRLGLVPAGDSGTYFQPIPFMQGAIDGTPTLSFRGQGLVAYQDFAPMAPIGRAPFAT